MPHLRAWHEVVVLNALPIKGKAITLKAGRCSESSPRSAGFSPSLATTG
jgi:hypothetical protein